MKTTLDIPDELFRRAKRTALERGTSLKAIVTAALERELGPATEAMPPVRTLVWPPPDSVTEMVDPEVVMKAIRALRDGLPEHPTEGDERQPEAVRRGSGGPVVIAVDTNVLVYAHRGDGPNHRAALDALDDLAERGPRWAIPWPCVHEFVAVCTGPAFGDRRTSLEGALQAVDAWLSHPACTTLGESEHHFSTLAALCRRAGLRGGAVHDARIAAICIDHRVAELWSCDRDFSRFPDLSVRNPVIPSLHEPLPPTYAAATTAPSP